MRNKNIKFLYFLEFLISAIYINRSSFWIDEGIRLHAVVFSNLQGVIEYGIKDKQLLFVLKQYFWTGIFGTSEIAARSLNLLFVILIIFFLHRILDSLKINSWYGLILFISPVYAYYMNDAGPYIILLAYSLGFYYYVFFTENFSDKRNVFMINLLFLLGTATHFIFGFIYIMYLVKIGYLFYKRKIDFTFKTHFFTGVCFAPIYLYLLFLYIGNVQSGSARGWSIPGLSNIALVIYYFIGNAGLGLSRNDIRAQKFELLTFETLFFPILLTIVFAILIILVLKKYRSILYKNSLMLSGALAYMVVFYLFSVKWHFQFWERHLIMAYPAFILLLIQLTVELAKSKKKKWLVVILYSLWMISSIQLRFNPYYFKDNYKDAIHYVLNSNKKIILYQGDKAVSNYYGISALPLKNYQEKRTIVNSEKTNYAINITNKPISEIKKIASLYDTYDIIYVFNEKYDKHNSAQYFLDNQKYHFKAFNTFKIFRPVNKN